MNAYLRRKHEELQLLDACLDESFAPATPKSINEAIALKFKLTAAIRAQHDLKDWTTTETAWSHRKKSSDSPFDFRYDYQRADLDVAGPSFYDLGDDIKCETVYTSSGMASISALLLASSHLFDRADIVSLPGTYGETLEFIEAYARHLKSITAVEVLGAPTSGASHRIFFWIPAHRQRISKPVCGHPGRNSTSASLIAVASPVAPARSRGRYGRAADPECPWL